MKVSVLFLKLYYYIGSFPYKLSWENGGTAEHPQNKIIKLVCTSSPFTEFFNILFVFVMLVKNVKNYIQEDKLVTMTFHSAWCAIIWVCGVNHYSVTFLRSQLIGIINESVQFLERMKEIFGQSTFDRHRTIRNLLITMQGGYCFFTVLLLPFLIVYFRYENVHFVNFLTPEYWKPIQLSNIGPLVLAVCVELWYETTIWGGFAFVTYVHLLYLQTTAGTIALLRAQKYTMKRKMCGRLQHSMRIYSEIRILNTTYNNTFRGFVWPVYLTLPCCIFIGGMCTFLKEKSGKIIIYGFSGCCASITMGFLISSSIFMAKVNTESESLLYTLKEKNCDKMYRKLCAAYKTIGIEVGSFYLVQRKSLFTLMGILTNATVSTLLSLNQIG